MENVLSRFICGQIAFERKIWDSFVFFFYLNRALIYIIKTDRNDWSKKTNKQQMLRARSNPRTRRHVLFPVSETSVLYIHHWILEVASN